MKTTRENIKNRIEEINKELEKITKLDKKFPQGELQCFKNENRYKWKVKEENGIRYLPKTERNQAEILALKKYYEYRKKELESEAAGWEAYLKKTDKMKINSEHLLNHPEYGKLLAKNLDHWIRNWSGGRRNPMKNVQSIRKIYWYKERMGRCCGLNQKQLLTECYIKIKYRFTMKKNWFWME